MPLELGLTEKIVAAVFAAVTAGIAAAYAKFRRMRKRVRISIAVPNEETHELKSSLTVAGQPPWLVMIGLPALPVSKYVVALVFFLKNPDTVTVPNCSLRVVLPSERRARLVASRSKERDPGSTDLNWSFEQGRNSAVVRCEFSMAPNQGRIIVVDLYYDSSELKPRSEPNSECSNESVHVNERFAYVFSAEGQRSQSCEVLLSAVGSENIDSLAQSFFKLESALQKQYPPKAPMVFRVIAALVWGHVQLATCFLIQAHFADLARGVAYHDPQNPEDRSAYRTIVIGKRAKRPLQLP